MFLLLAGTVVLFAQSQIVRISGNVKDTKGDVLPYATIRLKETSTGCITDYNGNFSFNGKVEGQTLIVSSMGYQDCEVALSSKTVFPLKIVLQEISYELDEVIIKPEKEKYQKKGNPAVELASEIINRKDDDNPFNNEYVSVMKLLLLHWTISAKRNNGMPCFVNSPSFKNMSIHRKYQENPS